MIMIRQKSKLRCIVLIGVGIGVVGVLYRLFKGKTVIDTKTRGESMVDFKLEEVESKEAIEGVNATPEIEIGLTEDIDSYIAAQDATYLKQHS